MMWKAMHKVLSKFIPKNVFKKKRTKWIVGISLFLIFRIGVSLSPITAIRYELCAMGHPIQAINTTKPTLSDWEIKKFLIFYTAKKQ